MAIGYNMDEEGNLKPFIVAADPDYCVVTVVDGKFKVRSSLLKHWINELMDVIVIDQQTIKVGEEPVCMFLSPIEMGDGVYGVQAASQYYYHKDASQLTRREAAAIASIFPLPLKWSPTHPGKNLRRKQTMILRNIRRLGPLEF